MGDHAVAGTLAPGKNVEGNTAGSPLGRQNARPAGLGMARRPTASRRPARGQLKRTCVSEPPKECLMQVDGQPHNVSGGLLKKRISGMNVLLS